MNKCYWCWIFYIGMSMTQISHFKRWIYDCIAKEGCQQSVYSLQSCVPGECPTSELLYEHLASILHWTYNIHSMYRLNLLPLLFHWKIWKTKNTALDTDELIIHSTILVVFTLECNVKRKNPLVYRELSTRLVGKWLERVQRYKGQGAWSPG